MKSFDTTVKKVYDTFLTKTIHARFAVVFRQWKECNVKIHGQLALRVMLKAQGAKNPVAKKSAAKSSKQKKGELPELTTQVCAENRKKRRELLDGRRRRKKLKTTKS